METKRIYIASDHRGVPLKAALVKWAQSKGHEVLDLGPTTVDRVNATDFAVKTVEAMRSDPAAVGVLICGTGQAMAMTANRYRHIRAALCSNSFSARMTRAHNDANILVLGAELVGEGLAIDCLETFLAAGFLGGVYGDRCQLLADLGGL